MATRSRAWCRHTRRSTAAAPVTPALRGRAQESKVRHALELLYYIREAVYDILLLKKKTTWISEWLKHCFPPKLEWSSLLYFIFFFKLDT